MMKPSLKPTDLHVTQLLARNRIINAVNMEGFVTALFPLVVKQNRDHHPIPTLTIVATL